MSLLPKCRCKLANGCHKSYDSRLHFVCVRCVALHLRDYQLRIKFRKNGQRGHSPCGHFNAGQRGQPPCWQWGQSPCGHSFLTQRGRRVYVVVRSFYRRCFNRFQMSELEIDLELFASILPLRAAGTVPVWAFSVGIPRGSFNGRRIVAFLPKTTCPNAASDGRSSHGRFAADHRVRTR